MNIPLIVNVIIFIALLFLLGRTRKTDWSLAKKVLAGLCLGIVFGRFTWVLWYEFACTARVGTVV